MSVVASEDSAGEGSEVALVDLATSLAGGVAGGRPVVAAGLRRSSATLLCVLAVAVVSVGSPWSSTVRSPIGGSAAFSSMSW